MKRFTFLVVLIAATVALSLNSIIEAATFDKNLLISDALFTDHDSMSVDQIQNFLEAEGNLLANWVDEIPMRRPSDNCVVHHATNMTAAEIIYEAATAWNAQVYNSNGCAISGAYWGDTNYSNYTLETVSPKALLVILQKEQSLISANGTYSTSSNSYKNPSCCSSNEYKLARAMGYGVPDSGGINEKFLGFYNQVNWAAWQLRFNFERSGGNTGWDGVDYITYTGPMTEGSRKRCGSCSPELFDGYYPIDGSPLYMGNSATASLYYYTPHTYPGYFGNYNFVQFYSDWFGPVNPQIYKAKLLSITPAQKITQGERKLYQVKFQNIGNATWYDKDGVYGDISPTRLISTKPLLHSSTWGEYWAESNSVANTDFAKVWGSNGSTVAANQNAVKPGHIVQLNFFMSTADANLPTDLYGQWLRLANQDGTIIEPSAKALIKHEKRTYASELIANKKTESLNFEERELSWAKFRNTGNVNWYDSDSIATAPAGEKSVRLISTKPVQRSSNFGDYWGPGKDIANTIFGKVYNSDGKTISSNQKVVKPGQVVKIDFFLSNSDMSLPSGTYTEWLRLQTTEDQKIIQPAFDVTVNYQGDVTRAAFVDSRGVSKFQAGERVLSWVKFKNTGNVIWYDDYAVNGGPGVTAYAPSGSDPIQLISTKNVLHNSIWGDYWGVGRNIPNNKFGIVYESDGSTVATIQNQVLPGQIVKIDFFVSTNDTTLSPGSYTEWVRLAYTNSGDIIQPHIPVAIELE